MTSKQLAYLRGIANTQNAILQIGKFGISDNLLKQIDDALEAREIIKLTVLETVGEDTKGIAYKISKATNSVVVQVIGNKIVLYRQREKNPKIILKM